MKKVLLTALLCSFIASPILASDFVVEQANMLSRITTKLESSKDDTASIEYLTKKKSCVESAANMGDLNDCIIKYPAAKSKILSHIIKD